jgi:hypothetical protein
MNHRQRTFAALLVLAGGVAAADAQPPQGPPAGYMGGAPNSMAPSPTGDPMGMPSRGGYGAGYGAGPAAHEALYNQYSQGMQGMHGGPATEPGRMPPDPFGPQRLHMPLPSRNSDFAGGSSLNVPSDPAQKSLGIRLDTSYTFFREFEVGYYGSEHQHVQAAALSFLPIQTPCWVVGARFGLGYNGNTGVNEDIVGATSDLFWGARIGHSYLKVGYFCDWTSEYRKHGVSGSLLTKLGPLGNFTFDGAFGYGAGSDEFINPTNIGLFRRVEIAERDTQIRVGKFLSSYFQTGLSGAWTNYRTAEDEYSGGLFANWFIGRVTVSADVTGGTSGLRGYLVLGFNWGGGANIDAHPIDPAYSNPIDTTSWVTRATRRDITMKLRETNTGFGPPQIQPIVFP